MQPAAPGWKAEKAAVAAQGIDGLAGASSSGRPVHDSEEEEKCECCSVPERHSCEDAEREAGPYGWVKK